MTGSRFLVSAAHKSSGKTVVSIGLSACLARQGQAVQPFKKGPDYIDPMWLSRATGRPCINLDFRIQSRAEIRDSYQRYRAGAEIVIVEGNKGLYDGMDVAGSDCNAALASHLNLPVLLVIDCAGVTRGIAPLLAGYQQFARDFRIAGVILNKVAGPRHEGKLVAAVERYTDLPVFGAIRRAPELVIEERHLGLTPSNEYGAADSYLDTVARVIGDSVDISALLAATRGGGTGATESAVGSASEWPSVDVTVAIARDSAFGFYYPDDLEAFRRNGARVRFFDTLRDETLPPADALFIGGGFPETHLDALSDNTALRQSIREYIEAGGVAYAECGGLMYLCRTLSYRGAKREMVGVLPADVVMQERPVGRGYMKLQPT
ncbi:MAG: cobyrinate a,c-diamide synthase, partial [Pseudomonadota bacterium]|nr:cobyrinate a,c-diamide synthase [Pseudomonadota bacterium]